MKKYWAVFRTQLENNLAYPVDLLSRSFSILIFLWIFTQLWRATFRSATGCELDCADQVMSGLTLRETLWYLMLAESIVLSKPRLAQTIARTVKDGSIAYLLNKPYNYLLYQASVGLGDSLLLLVMNLLAGGTLVWLLIGPPPHLLAWPAVILVVALAWLIDYCVTAMIGLAAFITEDVTAFEWIYQKVLFLLGGLLIPLDFYPQWLQQFASALPFYYTVYGPARFSVDPTPDRLLSLLAGQVMWLAVLGVIVAWFYRAGVNRLSINGG